MACTKSVYLSIYLYIYISNRLKLDIVIYTGPGKGPQFDWKKDIEAFILER